MKILMGNSFFGNVIAKALLWAVYYQLLSIGLKDIGRENCKGKILILTIVCIVDYVMPFYEISSLSTCSEMHKVC